MEGNTPLVLRRWNAFVKIHTTQDESLPFQIIVHDSKMLDDGSLYVVVDWHGLASMSEDEEEFKQLFKNNGLEVQNYDGDGIVAKLTLTAIQ